MLGHTVTLCLIFWGTARLSKAAAPFYIPTPGIWLPTPLHPRQHLLLSVFSVVALLSGFDLHFPDGGWWRLSFHMLYEKICFPSQNILRLHVFFQISHFTLPVRNAWHLPLSPPVPCGACLPHSRGLRDRPTHGWLTSPTEPITQLPDMEGDERTSNQSTYEFDRPEKEAEERPSGLPKRKPFSDGWNGDPRSLDCSFH